MRLIGAPLLLFAGALTVAAGVVTVVRWSRPTRRRGLARLGGLLLVQMLVVATVGLAVNRSERFYPSWESLLAPPPAVAPVVAPLPGRLDPAVTGAGKPVAWRPPSWPASATALLRVPEGYERQHATSFPVLLMLLDDPDQKSATNTLVPDTIVVTAAPTSPPVAPAASLTGLGEALRRELRVSNRGWVVVASARTTALAHDLIAADPTRYAGLAVVSTQPLRASFHQPGFGGAPHDSGHHADPIRQDLGVPVGQFGDLESARRWAVDHLGPALAAPRQWATSTPTAIR